MTQATTNFTLLPLTRRLLSVRQAADLLTISGETVRVWYHAGRLTGLRVGKQIRIDTTSVTALLEGGAQ